jgi:hypothetical protein
VSSIEPGFREAPVVGEEGCVRFGNRYVELQTPGAFMAGGFTLLLDLQPDVLTEQIVLGVRESGGSSLVLKSNVDDEIGRLRLEVGDRRGRMLVGDVLASEGLGKRIIVRVTPEDNEIAVAELQPWGPEEDAQILLRRQDGPRDLPAFTRPLILSGASNDGMRDGAFRGRLAEFAVFDRLLDPSRTAEYRQASLTRSVSDLPVLRQGALDNEVREIFRDDYAKLNRWREQGRLTRAEMREAAAIAHMWLCDRHPLLHRFADHYGLQISLPDMHPLRHFSEVARQSNPVFMYHQDRWEGQWLAPSRFLNDMAFWLAEHREVPWIAFIKFVRNKLGGGGHFDPEDRKRWQRDLQLMARETKIAGEEWMNVKMFALVRALAATAESCGLAELSRS